MSNQLTLYGSGFLASLFLNVLNIFEAIGATADIALSIVLGVMGVILGFYTIKHYRLHTRSLELKNKSMELDNAKKEVEHENMLKRLQKNLPE